MAEKTELINRLAFLEEENRKLAEDRERLKDERRRDEEKRWHSVEKGLATVALNVQELRSEVKTAHQSATNFQAVAEEMKRDRERTTLLLTGGDHPEAGLLFRTKQVEDDHREHLEEHRENKKWWLGLGAVAVGSAIKSAWDLIFHK